MRLDELETFARRHHGLVTRQAARRLGVSSSSWYRAIEAGLLDPLYPNVARMLGAPPTLQQRALAAVWAAGLGALGSHRTSAGLWGVERPADDPIEVLLSTRRRNVIIPGVVVHRPRDLVDLRPMRRDGVPTTNPLRMLLDLAAVDPEHLYPAAVSVLSLRLASPPALRAALMRHARKGRNGVTAFRGLLDQLAEDGRPEDSELEVRMLQLLVEYGLPPASFHPRVAGYEVDFLVIGSPVVLECDGWVAHGLDRDQFEYDRVRGADLVAAGFVVVRFTWRQVTSRPEQVAERIRDAIARWAPHLLAD